MRRATILLSGLLLGGGRNALQMKLTDGDNVGWKIWRNHRRRPATWPATNKDAK